MKSKVGGHDNAKSMHTAQAKEGRRTDSNVIKRTAEELGRSQEQIMVSRRSLGPKSGKNVKRRAAPS